MVTDIFIKTYYKDFIWLEYCLRSIKKFTSGFRNVVIISDDDGHQIPEKILGILANKSVHYVKVPIPYSKSIDHGVGYLWQQYIKLTWYKYTDADNVLMLDSDSMLTKPTCPDNFKVDDKFYWIYRKWEDAGTSIIWKDITKHALKVDPDYEAMCVDGFLMQKDTTIAFKNMFCSMYHTDDIWNAFAKNNITSFSEYNAFGTFIDKFDRKEYVKIYNASPEIIHNYSIIKSWSWGGLTDEDKQRREQILSS